MICRYVYILSFSFLWLGQLLDPTGDMFFYLIIGGSIVVFIVFLAVLIYCIKKKRAKRRKLEGKPSSLLLAERL